MRDQEPNESLFAFSILPFDLTDYTLTVKVNDLADAGIVVRSNANGSQFVLLVLGGYGYGQGVRSGNAGNAIYWTDSSNVSSAVNPVSGVFVPGGTYDIKVKVSGNSFSAYINGSSTAVTSITDAVAGASGRVGLYDDQPNKTTGSGFGTPTTFSDFVVKGTVASSAPIVTPVIVGKLGQSGWYVSNPTDLSWIVSGKPAPTQSGCGLDKVPETKDTKYMCSATNEVGSAKDSVTIKKDSVEPTVKIVSPASGATYKLNQKVTASYSCADSTSGDASCKGTVANGADIATSPAGAHSFVVTGKDHAGNTTKKSVPYTVR